MRQFLALSLIWPVHAFADSYACPQVDAVVENGSGYAERLCQTVEWSMTELAQCGLSVTRPLVVSVSHDIAENCVGRYQCGSDTIEVLHPDRIAEQIAVSALFSQLEVLEYFDSIVFHELVHAAYDEVPCPFPHCTATSEYLAYSLQIRALSPDARNRIGLGRVPNERVSGESFSAIIAYWVPDKFAIKAWTHLMQRPDPCSYVADMAAGRIFFDTDTPHIMAPPE